jgi:hypothetical protein
MMLLHMYSRTGWSARKLRKACLALLLATPGHFSRQLPSANFVLNMLGFRSDLSGTETAWPLRRANLQDQLLTTHSFAATVALPSMSLVVL